LSDRSRRLDTRLGGPANDLKYTPEQITDIPAETFLALMEIPEPGYHQFAAMWALTQKIRDADPDAREYLASMVIGIMLDKSRTVNQRFQCCYVISGSREERGVPGLINILLNDESEIMRSVAVKALARFLHNDAARGALLQSIASEKSSRVREALDSHLDVDVLEGKAPMDRMYTPEQITNTPAKVFLQRLASSQPGYHQSAALRALTEKMKQADKREQSAIRHMTILTMKDESRPIVQRWQCCYVLSNSGDVRGIPDLVFVLLSDESEVMRAVAAEALVMFRGDKLARSALLKSASTETSERVLNVLRRRLGEDMPA